MLKFPGKGPSASRHIRFHSPQNIGFKIALIVLPALLATACGKFFPSANELVSISISPSFPTIGLNATQQFSATGTFGDSTSQSLTSSVTWTSSDTTVATINSSGLASSLKTGSTTITAAKSGISGVTTLNVSTSGGGGGSLTIGCSGCLSQGSGTFTASLATGTVTFTATNNGSAVSPTWSSSNTGVANINSSTGVTTLVATGSTTITASANGATGSITLTVQ